MTESLSFWRIASFYTERKSDSGHAHQPPTNSVRTTNSYILLPQILKALDKNAFKND